MKELKDLRLVSWVPYNISEIQKGIQSGHCALEYARKRTLVRHPENTKELWDFVDNYKTWMVYNGGTTNTDTTGSVDNLPMGTLNKIPVELFKLGIKYATFYEPDLNGALSCVCCIIDYSGIDFESPIEDVNKLSQFIRRFRFA